MHCKPRSTRHWLPIWADPISSKGGHYEEKNCKLTSILRAIALPLVGSAGGWLYYRYVGCATGTCAVTSSPWLSTGFGCVLGSLLYTVLRPGRGKRQDGNGAE